MGQGLVGRETLGLRTNQFEQHDNQCSRVHVFSSLEYVSSTHRLFSFTVMFPSMHNVGGWMLHVFSSLEYVSSAH